MTNIWPSFRKNSLNNAVQEIKNYNLGKFKTFSFKTNGLIWSTPIIDEKENIYVGSADRYLYSINNNGDLIWKYKINDTLDSLIDSASLIVDNKIIIPGGDGYIHAVNKNTGDLIWKFKAYHAEEEQEKSGQLVNSFEGNIATHKDYLYAGSDNGYMYCIDKNGKEVWNFKTGMMIWSSPCFFDSWMAFGSLDGYLYLLNFYTGQLLDKTKLGEIKASPTYDPENNLLFIGATKGTMNSIQIIDDKFKKKWNLKIKNEIYSSAVYYQKNIYFASGQNFYCVNYAGEILWKYNTFSKISSSPVIIKNEMIVFGGGNGKLYALDFDGKRIWSFKTTSSPHKANLDSSPAVSDNGNIYVGSYNGNIYKIPFKYCLNNQDERCQFHGISDAPVYDGNNFKFEDPESNLVDSIKIGLSEPIKIKMFVFEKGNYIENSALNSIKINITPKIDFSYFISSDGKFIDILPKNFWKQNTDYKIDIKASYYKKTNFIVDLFKRFFLPEIEGSLNFSTEKNQESFNKSQTFFIKDISLYQPLALNTLVAAALDGQRFIAEFFIKEGNKIEIILEPVYESNRQIVLKGTINGKYFSAQGNPLLSAMGGTIPLKNAIFSGEIENGVINKGMFFAKINCFQIKGNSKNYNLPLNIISEICGRDFNLVIVGRYSGVSN